MTSITRSSIAILCLLFVSLSAYSQLETSKYEIGINGGTLIYQGDLVPGYFGNWKTAKPALGLFVNRSLDEYFAIRANLVVGNISSDEAQFSKPAYRQKRNLKFNSSVTELTALVVFTPFGESDIKESRFTPYVFAGAGASFLNIKRDWSGFDTITYPYKSTTAKGLAIDTLQKLPRTTLALPLGFGLKYAINSGISLNAEVMYRFLGSDYVDGFKYAANPKNRDNYYGLSLGIIYRIGAGNLGGGGRGGYGCPVVR